MVPTWTYVKGDDGIYVNMFIGSTINVEKVAGTDIQMVQKTDYPWNGNISITVNPKGGEEIHRLCPRAGPHQERTLHADAESQRRQAARREWRNHPSQDRQ
jgi:hypothetical protein